MKRQRRKAAYARIAALLSIALLLGFVPMETYASNTQQKINQTQNEKKDLEGKLDQTQDQLDDLKGEHNSLRGKLDNLKAQLTQVSENLEQLEQQIVQKTQEISDTQAALEEAKATEEWQYECMKMRIRYMYERNESDYLDIFFNSGSFAEFLNVADYFEQIAEYDQKMLGEYEENRKFIQSEEERLAQEKADLDNLKAEAEAEKSKVSGLISQTSSTISQYADQISDAEQKALDYEASIREKEKDLTYLQKKLAEEIAKSQAAANATWRNISEVSFAEGDRYLLANIIYCEAGGESFDGQLAVGAVIVNRVLSSVFPDSVVGVVYQKGQFSPVASGRLELALASNKATESCYRAADQAMAGMSNVGNCVFFRTPVEGLTGISIGGHIFY